MKLLPVGKALFSFVGDYHCTFLQGEDSINRGDHRGQMMTFCGHEKWCSEFNSQRVLQRAKSNIDKHYPVIGGKSEEVSMLIFFHFDGIKNLNGI